MVKRRNLKDPWECSWSCGFKDYDIAKVVEHEKQNETLRRLY